MKVKAGARETVDYWGLVGNTGICSIGIIQGLYFLILCLPPASRSDQVLGLKFDEVQGKMGLKGFHCCKGARFMVHGHDSEKIARASQNASQR